MSEGGPMVIIGAGMAGGVAARTLREEGYAGRLVLIGHEPTVPFGRPPLSKTYLRGEESLDVQGDGRRRRRCQSYNGAAPAKSH